MAGTGTIKISSEQLKSQAAQLTSLQKQYEILFGNITSDLNSLNGNWSNLLANNFIGKINSAQRSFAAIDTMLTAGIKAADTAARDFTSVDSALAKLNLEEVDRAVKKVIHGTKKVATKSAKKSVSTTGRGILESVGRAVQKAGTKVRSKVKKKVQKTIDEIVDSYKNKGTVYKACKVGLAVMKGALAVAAIGAIVATGGPVSPLAVAALAVNANTIVSSVVDSYNILKHDDYTKTDVMDEVLKGTGKMAGKALGNEEAGEKAGKAISSGVKLAGTLYSLDAAYKALQPDGLLKTATGAAKVTGKVTSNVGLIKGTTGSITGTASTASGVAKMAIKGGKVKAVTKVVSSIYGTAEKETTFIANTIDAIEKGTGKEVTSYNENYFFGSDKYKKWKEKKEPAKTTFKFFKKAVELISS